MHVCMYTVLHSIESFTSLFLMYTRPSRLYLKPIPTSQATTDKIQGKHFHIPFPTLSFTTSSPFPLSFPLFLHIPFLHFAFSLNSVSGGNWEHVGLSGPII